MPGTDAGKRSPKTADPQSAGGREEGYHDDEEGSRGSREHPEVQAMRRSVVTAIVLVSLAAAMAFGYMVFMFSRTNSRQGMLDRAASEAADGSYAEAVRMIDRALSIPGGGLPTDEMLYLKKAEYLQKVGETDEAVSIAMRVMKDAKKDGQEYMEAWNRIVSVCAETEDYGKLASLLEGCDSEKVRETYYNYLVFDPEFLTQPGTYENELILEVTGQGEGTIFYTIDGSQPTDKSMMYQDGIRLGPGIYTVKILFVNRYGLKSSTVTGTYQILDS